MNTDKTLRAKFASNSQDYPIWYYKEIEEVEVDDVVFNLLKETFVVEIDGKKIVITFGKNRKHEIGSTQSCNEGLDYTSFETIRKAFREGKWFRILEDDTTDEFKEEYRIKEEEKIKKSMREAKLQIIANALEQIKKNSGFQIGDIDKQIKELQNISDEELESLVNQIFKKFKK